MGSTCQPNRSKPAGVEPRLVDFEAAAALLSISRRHLEDLAREGRLPAPVRLGRAVRFSVDALRRFVEAEARKAAAEQVAAGGHTDA
jgi:excisionase family DNA binding protein